MNLELSHLRLVVTVADAEDLRTAAHRLQISQQCLLQRLARIEAAFGGALFAHGDRYLEPTPAGRYVVDCSRGILDTLADMGTP
ncbi:helix-turn-helix domain-containing protein [Longispora urticae]